MTRQRILTLFEIIAGPSLPVACDDWARLLEEDDVLFLTTPARKPEAYYLCVVPGDDMARLFDLMKVAYICLAARLNEVERLAADIGPHTRGNLTDSEAQRAFAELAIEHFLGPVALHRYREKMLTALAA